MFYWKEFKNQPLIVNQKRTRTKKQKQKNAKPENPFKIFEFYKPLMLMDFMEGELVVVERSWLSIMESFPEAFYQPVYGS